MSLPLTRGWELMAADDGRWHVIGPGNYTIAAYGSPGALTASIAGLQATYARWVRREKKRSLRALERPIEARRLFHTMSGYHCWTTGGKTK